ncbi:MAG: inositol monophosphatase family protein [Bacteroidota bacterium]
MTNLSALRYAVVGLCYEVGAFIRQESQNFDRSKIEVKGHNDLVSYVDKTAEKRLVQGLKKILPEAGFIAEEGTADHQGQEQVWVIDPLDGTTNFTHGLPPFAVSVGLLQANNPVLGVVYEVGGDEMFSAAQGAGALLNGKPIQVKPSKSLGEGLMATGFPYTVFDWMDKYMAVMQAFMGKTQGVRRFGSAATDLAYLACGRFDGFFEKGLKPWDVAGGVAILREAGGIVTDFSGGDNWLHGGEIMAGNQLQPEMLAVVMEHWK